MPDSPNITRLINAKEYTWSGVASDSPVKAEPLDVIFRVTADESQSLGVSWAETSVFEARFHGLLEAKTQQVGLLSQMVKWQHRLIDYNSHYNAFLIDQLSEDEFEKVAGEYLYEATDIPADTIAPIISQIYGLTGIYYTPSELADFFQCKPDTVVRALSAMEFPTPEILKMIPSTAE